MPIQFVCPQCQKLLQIGQRKIGHVIQCPKCGVATIVPDKETAAAQMAALRGMTSGEVVELVVYDDVSEVVARAQAAPPAMYPSSSAYPAAMPQAAPTAREEPGEWLLVSRGAIVAQALLFLVVTAVTFGIGYAVGQQRVALDPASTTKQKKAESMSFRGIVTYDVGQGAFADADAVVVLLPLDRRGEKRLKVPGLRYDEDSAAARDLALEEVQSLGGDVVRADPTGEFHLIIRQPGDYQLLMISRKALRAAGAGIPQHELDDLNGWFEAPGNLIARQQYFWQRLTFVETPPLFQYTLRGVAQ